MDNSSPSINVNEFVGFHVKWRKGWSWHEPSQGSGTSSLLWVKENALEVNPSKMDILRKYKIPAIALLCLPRKLGNGIRKSVLKKRLCAFYICMKTFGKSWDLKPRLCCIPSFDICIKIITAKSVLRLAVKGVEAWTCWTLFESDNRFKFGSFDRLFWTIEFYSIYVKMSWWLHTVTNPYKQLIYFLGHHGIKGKKKADECAVCGSHGVLRSYLCSRQRTQTLLSFHRV